MENKIKTVLIGADPEMFVKDSTTNEIVSAIGLIPGTKDEPYSIDLGCAVQTDNVMVEFCIPPANNPEDFIKSIEYAKNSLDAMLPDNITTVVQASAVLDPKYLKSKEAQTFGCDPEFSVYTISIIDPPDARGNLRSAGGHIHIGYENPDAFTNMRIVMAMDLFLGIPSIILDKDRDRKKMYGAPGSFREKHYGVEYRTLSNFWLESKESMEWAFRESMRAVKFVFDDNTLDDDTITDIQLAISNQDIDLACKIAKKYNIIIDFKEEAVYA